MTLTVVGLAVGLLMSGRLSRLLASFLVEVAPTDPVTYVAMASGFVLVGFIASYLPARHAAGIDPVVALREE